jgi:cytochrome bd-type quinol oxidase subunit 1
LPIVKANCARESSRADPVIEKTYRYQQRTTGVPGLRHAAKHIYATHVSAVCLAVPLGALISAFWILAANSWMQTPAGFRREADGKFAPVSWMDAIFTPSLPYRYLRMVPAAHLAGTFVVIGVCGFYLWRRRHQEFAGAGLSVALW